MSGFYFWMKVAVCAVAVVLALPRLVYLLFYLFGRIPWIHRVDGGMPEGTTPVVVSCHGKGRISAKGKGKEVRRCLIERVFAVPNKKLRVGCHGRYKLGQAEFFAQTVGGDPLCGGGMKYYFMSRLSELRVRFCSYVALKRGRTVEGFVQRLRDGKILWDTIYVGAQSDITKAFSFPEKRLVPARLQPAA